MSVLRSIESKLESLFEGVFGRAFRTNVQPVELARKLAKEMDDHRTVSVSRVYVPNEYTIYLSPKDREQFENYEGDLLDELADYLTEHARRESYALMTPPVVKLETDDDLGLGVFGIATRMVQTARAAASPAAAARPPVDAAPPSATMIYRPEPTVSDAAAPVDERPAFIAWEGAAPGARQAAHRDRPVAGVRHPGHRYERLAAARGGAPGRRQVLARRSRLDERRRVERQACAAARARGRHPLHGRLDGADLQPGAAVMPLASAQVETTLLVLKVAFLVLLYLFIWRIVRSAARDIRAPQESMILGPQQAAAAGLVPPPRARELGRFVVLTSPELEPGDAYPLGPQPLTVGRADRRQRHRAARRRVHIDPACAVRAAPRRRLRRGRGLDERHVRERDAADARASPGTR